MDAKSVQVVQLVVTIAASIFIPLAVAYIANRYAAASRERELATKYVELAIQILNQPLTIENRPVHEWALAVLNKYAPIPLPAEMIDQQQTIQMLQMSLDSNRRNIETLLNQKNTP